MTHRASHAVEPAPGVEEALGAVAGDGGTGAGDLLVHPGVMLNTSGDVSPGPVLLKYQTLWIKQDAVFKGSNCMTLILMLRVLS